MAKQYPTYRNMGKGQVQVTYQLVEGNLPLTLQGTFKPWAIGVGHSKILLRGLSGGEEGDAPRVFDVLFQDVSRISLADRYAGLSLSDAGPEALRTEERRAGRSWGEVFGDETVVAAMIDHLVRHAEVHSLKGDSFRMRGRELGCVPTATTDND
ncbi:ATP-binding protein [Streptomyces sp. NPDC047515]|uniref:ATP-binding protein n=1 Tax=Streptomyces sp. NPDC047515 TaxID=3155380 RepID=UPI0033FE3A8C